MLTLHLPDGTLRVGLADQAASDLLSRLQALHRSWQQAVPPPRPQLDVVYADPVRIEFFCNPNLWPHPSAAQVLVTVRHPQVQLSAQMPLPQLLADLEAWLAGA